MLTGIRAQVISSLEPKSSVEAVVSEPVASASVESRELATTLAHKSPKPFSLYSSLVKADERFGLGLGYLAKDHPNRRLIWEHWRSITKIKPKSDPAIPLSAALMIATAKQEGPNDEFAKILLLKLMERGLEPASVGLSLMETNYSRYNELKESKNIKFIQQEDFLKVQRSIEEFISPEDRLAAYRKFYESSDKSPKAKLVFLGLLSETKTPNPEKFTLARDILQECCGVDISDEILAKLAAAGLDLQSQCCAALNQDSLISLIRAAMGIGISELKTGLNPDEKTQLYSKLAKYALSINDAVTFEALFDRGPDYAISPEDFLAGIHAAIQKGRYQYIMESPGLRNYCTKYYQAISEVRTEPTLKTVIDLMLKQGGKQTRIPEPLLAYIDNLPIDNQIQLLRDYGIVGGSNYSALARHALAIGDDDLLLAAACAVGSLGKKIYISDKDFLAGTHTALSDGKYVDSNLGRDGVNYFCEARSESLSAITTEPTLKTTLALMLEKGFTVPGPLLPYVDDSLIRTLANNFLKGLEPLPTNRASAGRLAASLTDRVNHLSGHLTVIVESSIEDTMKSACISRYIERGGVELDIPTLNFINSEAMNLDSLIAAFVAASNTPNTVMSSQLGEIIVSRSGGLDKVSGIAKGSPAHNFLATLSSDIDIGDMQAIISHAEQMMRLNRSVPEALLDTLEKAGQLQPILDLYHEALKGGYLKPEFFTNLEDKANKAGPESHLAKLLQALKPTES